MAEELGLSRSSTSALSSKARRNLSRGTLGRRGAQPARRWRTCGSTGLPALRRPRTDGDSTARPTAKGGPQSGVRPGPGPVPGPPGRGLGGAVVALCAGHRRRGRGRPTPRVPSPTADNPFALRARGRGPSIPTEFLQRHDAYALFDANRATCWRNRPDREPTSWDVRVVPRQSGVIAPSAFTASARLLDLVRGRSPAVWSECTWTPAPHDLRHWVRPGGHDSLHHQQPSGRPPAASGSARRRRRRPSSPGSASP